MEQGEKKQSQFNIIFISSVMSQVPHVLPNSTPYNMSKAAIDAMMKTMASDLSKYNIRVNCIHPGYILTKGEEKYAKREIIVQNTEKYLPFGIGNPDDVSNGVLFLLENRYTTGSILTIDGGFRISQRIHGLHQPIDTKARL